MSSNSSSWWWWWAKRLPWLVKNEASYEAVSELEGRTNKRSIIGVRGVVFVFVVLVCLVGFISTRWIDGTGCKARPKAISPLLLAEGDLSTPLLASSFLLSSPGYCLPANGAIAASPSRTSTTTWRRPPTRCPSPTRPSAAASASAPPTVGWLITADQRSMLQLLNPLTDERVDLPHLPDYIKSTCTTFAASSGTSSWTTSPGTSTPASYTPSSSR